MKEIYLKMTDRNLRHNGRYDSKDDNKDGKKLLVFKHNPKAAGGTLLSVLRQMKPKNYSNKQYEDYLGKQKKVKKMDLDSSLVEITEGQWLNPEFRKHAFVISSVREPCSQLLSLWTFGSNGSGGTNTTLNNNFDIMKRRIEPKNTNILDSIQKCTDNILYRICRKD